MKKIIILFVSILLLFNIVVPVSASTEESPFFYGKQKLPVIDDHLLNYALDGTMESRPTLMIGDSTIDGKIDANDALFALIYGLNGTFHNRVPGSMPNNPYEFSLHATSPATMKSKMERFFRDYYTGEYPAYKGRLERYHYIYNSALMADVSDDGECNAVDAMYILQYAVGMIDSFPRSDFEEVGNMFYFPWIDEWRPRMLWNGRDSFYENVVLPAEPVA